MIFSVFIGRCGFKLRLFVVFESENLGGDLCVGLDLFLRVKERLMVRSTSSDFVLFRLRLLIVVSNSVDAVEHRNE